MKGVSEFVTVLLILIIAIASILVVWLFYNSMFGSVTMSEDTSSLGEALSSCMKIDSARDNKIYLRNCGTGTIRNDSTSVYMDEAPIAFTMTPSSIGKGQVAEIALSGLWGMPLGNHKIRISNKAGEVQRYVKVSLPDSRVLDLEFDEGQGNITYDSSSYGNNGTLQNQAGFCDVSHPCPQWTDGKFGKALYFQSGGYVNASNKSILNINKDMTINAWIKLIGEPSGKIVGKGNIFAPPYSYDLNIGGHQLMFSVYNGSDTCFVSLGFLPSDSDWHFITFVVQYNPSVTLNSYFDGKLNHTNSCNNFFQTASSQEPIEIGLSMVTIGTIDSLIIYNKALTPDQTVSLTLGELT